MSDASNPYAVTTLEISKPDSYRHIVSRPVRWMVVAAMPLLLIGSAAAVLEIESIIFSGPVMLCYGLILLFLTRSKEQRLLRWFAWTCFLFPVFVFLIIFLLSWSPGDAQVPISSLCCVVAVGVSLRIVLQVTANRDLENPAFGQVEMASEPSPSGDGQLGDSAAVLPAKAP